MYLPISMKEAKAMRKVKISALRENKHNMERQIKNLRRRIRQYEKSSQRQHEGIMFYKNRYDELQNRLINAVSMFDDVVPPLFISVKDFDE